MYSPIEDAASHTNSQQGNSLKKSESKFLVLLIQTDLVWAEGEFNFGTKTRSLPLVVARGVV